MQIYTFNEYQSDVGKFAVALDSRDAWVHGILGLVGEAGELAEKYKKQVRDGTDVENDDLKKELGDVLWYVSYLALLNGITLEDVAVSNFKKLESRAQRGVLSGSGDNR
jgi:NTP pyrophosphatase (non-canonical NTP hydrolase)